MKKFIVILSLFCILANSHSQERFSYPGGEFVGENGNWKEIIPLEEETEYLETARDKFWITLFQKKTGKTITIPIQGGQAFIAEDEAKKKWKPIFIIKKIGQKKVEEKIATQEKQRAKKEKIEEISTDFKSTCISSFESELIKYLLKYRNEKKLGPLKVSKSLTHIAKIHARDLATHPRQFGCLLQSWSNRGNWTPCCYTADHKNAECMLNKPLELTDYKSQGYEIAYQAEKGKQAEPKIIFETWKNSLGNSSVIGDLNGWETKNWKSFGIGIYNEIAVIWLGKDIDPEPVPGTCNELY